MVMMSKSLRAPPPEARLVRATILQWRHEFDAAKSDLDAVTIYEAVADRLLFDARAPRDATRPGGLGKSFDWRLLENLDLDIPSMLSGGLDAGNVGEALRITRAPGVDVSSGVERSPGQKDPDKIRGFIRAVREAAALVGLEKVKSPA